MNFLAQTAQQSQDIDWVKIVGGIWAILVTVVLPVLAKRYSTVRKVLEVVVKGVEEGDHDGTKGEIKKAAEAAGLESKLAPVVAKVTGETPTAPQSKP